MNDSPGNGSFFRSLQHWDVDPELVCADTLPDCFLNWWPLSGGVCGIVSRQHQKSNYCLTCRDMNPYWNRYLIIEDEGKPTWSKHNNKQMHPESATPKTLGQEHAKNSKHTCKQKSKTCNFWKFFFSFFSCIFLIFLFVVFLNFLSSDRRPSQKCNKMHNSRIRIFFFVFFLRFSFVFFRYPFCLLFIIVWDDTALKR